LKIEANLLHGGKQAVDKMEQISSPDNEHLMSCGYYHMGHIFAIG